MYPYAEILKMNPGLIDVIGRRAFSASGESFTVEVGTKVGGPTVCGDYGIIRSFNPAGAVVAVFKGEVEVEEMDVFSKETLFVL